MNIVRAALTAGSLAATLAFAAPALATPNTAIYSLGRYVGAGAAPAGPYGTVTLTQNAGSVDVLVNLTSPLVQGFTMAGNDGPDVFLFDLTVFPVVPNPITIITPGFTADEGINNKNKPKLITSSDTGDWEYGVQCTANCGAQHPLAGPLEFTVANVLITDFIPNDFGNVFSADLCVGSMGRGNNCVVTGDVVSPVPEPASVAVLGLGLLGLGGLITLLRRRASTSEQQA